MERGCWLVIDLSRDCAGIAPNPRQKKAGLRRLPFLLSPTLVRLQVQREP